MRATASITCSSRRRRTTPALAFYRDTLGWHVDFTWGGDGQPRGCQLDGGAMKLVIAEPHDANDQSWSGGVNGRRPTVHLQVDDLDARFAQIADRSRVVVAPERTHWGTRWFVLCDPDDNLIAYESPKTRHSRVRPRGGKELGSGPSLLENSHTDHAAKPPFKASRR